MKRFFLFALLLAAVGISYANDYYSDIKDAQKGHKIAQYNIGIYYYNGTGGVSRNYEKAVEWFRKSANQGYASAQSALGQIYSDGNGVPKDYSMAVYWYTKAAAQGHDGAQNNLGVLYGKGHGVPKDPYKAFELYSKAAAQDNMVAQYNVGNCYANGKGVTKNEYSAFRYYQKSAEQGYAKAQDELGDCYHYGRGVSENDYTAVTWYRKAAEQGIVNSQSALGIAYCKGEGVSKDFDWAVHWLRKAQAEMDMMERIQNKKRKNKEAGYDDEEDEEDDDDDNKYNAFTHYLNTRYLYIAGYELGNCYYNGSCGKTRDYQTALAWFRDAANHDNYDAMYMVGRCYALGNGVARNKTTAFEWYSKAAYNGQTDAAYELGLCYKNGSGVGKDPEKALDYFEKAADKGHVEAMYEAGQAYEEMEIDTYAGDWYLDMIKKGNEVQKAKAEKRLQVLSDNYIYTHTYNMFASRAAYDYIHQGSLTLKAAHAEEKIYTKQTTSQDYTYRTTGRWEAESLPTGKYYVKRVRENWEDRYDTITIVHPSSTVTLPPMQPKTGTLVVKSRPKKAFVYVDGVNMGVTPWTGQVQIGEHKVRVGGKKGRIDAPTQNIRVPYKGSTSADFKLKSEWYHGSDWHPDHYLEPMYGIEFAQYERHHYAGVRYGWIPKRFGLDVTALYGITNQELSATIGPTFRLTSFDCPLSLQLALGGGAMYRFTDKHITWVADAALRFGLKEGYKDHKFGWWSFSLGARYYDGRYIPTASVSLMPIRALTLAAMALEDDFPRIYTEIQAGHEFRSRQWMMGAQLNYIPGHLGIGTDFMIGFEGGWDVMIGPVFRLTPDYIPFDFQLYQGFGYGHFDRNGFMAHTSLKFAFGHNLPYWGLWSFNIGCIYGSGNVGVTFGVSLPIISIIGTAGAASVLYL